MANFQKSGHNVNGQVLSAVAGTTYEIGLWGPIDTRNGNELQVWISSGGAGAMISKGGMQGNARIYSISRLPTGRTTLSAQDGAKLVWTTVTLEARPATPAAVNGRYTTEPNEAVTTLTVPRIRDVWNLAYNGWTEIEDVGARVLTAQWAHETGFGAHCFNWNLGNVKATGVDVPHMYLRDVWEYEPPAAASKTVAASGGLGHLALADEIAAHKWPPKAGNVIIVYEPPHPYARFRAYGSLQEGAQKWLAHHQSIWRSHPTYVALLNAGDVAGVARTMKDARYYGGPEAFYASNMNACKQRIDRELGPVT